MISCIRAYKIVFDGNDGQSYEEVVYCKYNNSCDTQQWLDSGGRPVDFDYVTDSKVDVLAKCILGIPTNNKYYYWQELDDFKLPEAVDREFNGCI
jgi:hypothetical protein